MRERRGKIPGRIFVSVDRQWAKTQTPICTKEYVQADARQGTYETRWKGLKRTLNAWRHNASFDRDWCLALVKEIEEMHPLPVSATADASADPQVNPTIVGTSAEGDLAGSVGATGAEPVAWAETDASRLV